MIGNMNKLNETIRHVFPNQACTVEKTGKGLTNDNYLLTIDEKRYIVRVPKEDFASFVDRKREREIELQVQDLSVPLIYFDAASGIKITEYVEGLYEYADCPYEDKIERCARLMKQLHRHKAIGVKFDAFQMLQDYRRSVSKPLFDLSPYEENIQAIKDFHHPLVLCHNDFVSGNILFGKQRDYLIDYEYGADNDPLFDVISFLSENQIFDESLRERFYAEYFETMNDELRRALYAYEQFENVLWCNWAMMMYENRRQETYRQIAQDKYDALLKMEAH